MSRFVTAPFVTLCTRGAVTLSVSFPLPSSHLVTGSTKATTLLCALTCRRSFKSGKNKGSSAQLKLTSALGILG